MRLVILGGGESGVGTERKKDMMFLCLISEKLKKTIKKFLR